MMHWQWQLSFSLGGHHGPPLFLRSLPPGNCRRFNMSLPRWPNFFVGDCSSGCNTPVSKTSLTYNTRALISLCTGGTNLFNLTESRSTISVHICTTGRWALHHQCPVTSVSLAKSSAMMQDDGVSGARNGACKVARLATAFLTGSLRGTVLSTSYR